MDFRKIQSTAGGATSIVSLPRSWIKKNNLQQSDEIGIIERKDGVLFLIAKPDIKKKKTAYIDANGKELNFLLRIIISEYIRGADVIKFRKSAFSRIEKKNIREFIQNAIIGLDLNEHGNLFEIHSIVDVYDLDVELIIMRLCDLTCWMFGNTVRAMEGNNCDLFKDIIKRDIEVDRLTLLAYRQMHLASGNPESAIKVGIDSHDALYYKIVASCLESAGDCSVSISEAYLKLIPLDIAEEHIKNLSKLFSELGKNLENVVNSFTCRNLNTANSVIERCISLSKDELSAEGKCLFITDKSITHNSLIVGSFAIVLENLAMVNNLTRDIAEIVIDRGRKNKS